jgi:hypothetical protein
MKVKELLDKIAKLENGRIEITLIPHSLIITSVVFNIECNNGEWKVLDMPFTPILDFEVLAYDFIKAHRGNFLLIEYEVNC